MNTAIITSCTSHYIHTIPINGFYRYTALKTSSLRGLYLPTSYALHIVDYISLELSSSRRYFELVEKPTDNDEQFFSILHCC